MVFLLNKDAKNAGLLRSATIIARQFSHYTLIGVVATVLYIGMITLAIDRLRLDPFLATSAITVLIFFFKFYAYVRTRLIHQQFLPFVGVNAVSSVMSAALIIVLIELVTLSAFISSVLVTGAMFILRFILMKVVGLVRETDDEDIDELQPERPRRPKIIEKKNAK